MKKYAKVIDEQTKSVSVGTGTNTAFYKSIGMTEMEVEQAYNGGWYLKGFAPQKTIDEQNEEIRQAREQAYEIEADKLKLDYDEALARGAENAEELKIAWLAKKDEIRARLPYLELTENSEEPSEDVSSLEENLNNILEK